MPTSIIASLSLLFGFVLPAYAQSDLETTDELEEIIVEEQGEPETELPLGIGLSGETLITAPGSGGDPLRTLQSLPGLTYTNDTAAEPAVRGSRPGDNYFQTDFAPSYYLFHLGGAISVYNADLVESFNIYQSAYGPEFSGVTGGVFDVKLREPQKDKFHATVDVSLLQAGVLVEGPVNDSQSFYLAGRISYLDLFLAGQIPEEDGIKIEEFPKYSDYQGKYVWDTDNLGKFTAQFNGANDSAQVDVAEDSEEIDTDPIIAGTTLFDTSFHEQAIRWDMPVGDRLEVRSLLSHSSDLAVGEFGGAGEIDVASNTFLLKSHATFSLNDKHDVQFGADVQTEDVDLDLALSIPNCGELDPGCLLTGSARLESQQNFNYREFGGFVKDNWYITDRLTLFPGLSFRAENLLDKQFIEPRFALEYVHNEDTIFTAGFGQYHQTPEYLQIDEVFGNPDLDYIESLHAQVGIQKYLKNGWSVKSELYFKSLDNLVVSDDEQQYLNEAKGQAFGLDTLIRKDLTDKLSGWASVSLSKVNRTDKRTNEDFVFDFDQPVNISLVGKYKLNQKWSFGAKFWLHSGAPYTPIIGATEDPNIPGFFRPEYGELNSSRFPTYHRLDLRVDRDWKLRKFDLGAYFELFNVLQTENAAGYDYNFDYSEREISPQLAGFFSFGLKAKF